MHRNSNPKGQRPDPTYLLLGLKFLIREPSSFVPDQVYLWSWQSGKKATMASSGALQILFSGISRSYLDVSPSVRMVLDIRLKVFGAFGIVVAFGCTTLVLVEV